MTRANKRQLKGTPFTAKKEYAFQKKWNPTREEIQNQDESFKTNLSTLCEVAAKLLKKKNVCLKDFPWEDLAAEGYIYCVEKSIPKMLETWPADSEKQNTGSYLLRGATVGAMLYIQKEFRDTYGAMVRGAKKLQVVHVDSGTVESIADSMTESVWEDISLGLYDGAQKNQNIHMWNELAKEMEENLGCSNNVV